MICTPVDYCEKISLCVGSNVYDNTVVLPQSIVGKGAILINSASVVCHSNTGGNFELAKIVLQNNVTLRTGARLQQVVVMETDLMMLEKGLAMTGEVMEADSVWFGAPAARLLSYWNVALLHRTQALTKMARIKANLCEVLGHYTLAKDYALLCSTASLYKIGMRPSTAYAAVIAHLHDLQCCSSEFYRGNLNIKVIIYIKLLLHSVSDLCVSVVVCVYQHINHQHGNKD